MGALYLKDLAEKTRRGLESRVHAGRCTGDPAYGYIVVRNLKEDGELDRGLRAIDPDKAAIVRRIFEAYAGGASPRRIAQTLNAEAIAGPRSGVWFNASIRGRAKRGDGLLRNELYIGRMVWRRRVNAKDPVSGARIRRDNLPKGHLIIEVPHLRIIDDELWRRVQDRLRREAAPYQAGPNGVQSAFWDRRRPRHLLSGKVFCGVCARQLSLFGRDYLGCKAAAHGTCRNRRTVRRTVLQARVMDVLSRQLMQPDLLAEFITAFNQEWRRLAGEVRSQAVAQQREKAALDRKIANLVEAVSDGRSSPSIMAKLADLEAQKTRLGDVPTPPTEPAPALHPGISQVYAAKVRNLAHALEKGENPEALEAARSLIDKVILHPPETDDDPPGVELIGELTALLKAGGVGDNQVGSYPQDRSRSWVVRQFGKGGFSGGALTCRRQHRRFSIRQLITRDRRVSMVTRAPFLKARYSGYHHRQVPRRMPSSPMSAQTRRAANTCAASGNQSATRTISRTCRSRSGSSARSWSPSATAAAR